MSNKHNHMLLLVALLIILLVCSEAVAKNEPLCAEQLGSAINNFCVVKPDLLWRGERPDREGAAWLISRGVKTIINLELISDDLDTILQAKVPASSEFQIDYFRVKAWEPQYAVAQAAADRHVIHFLAIISKARLPVYVHCRAGENRTGVMVAAYKIILGGQTSPEQIKGVISEMQSYKGAWSHFTAKYIEGLALRRDAILEKVRMYKLEFPTRVVCKAGKCFSDGQR